MQSGLRGTGAVREAAQEPPQVTLDALDALAGHGPDIEIEAAGIRVARQAPRIAAADRGDRHIGMLAHIEMPSLVVARPLGDVVLQIVHEGNGVDHVRLIGQRRMRNGAADGDAHPDAPHIGDRDAHAGRFGKQGKIGGDAVSDQMTCPDAVAGIGDALELLDGGLLDLAHDTAERNIALEPDAGLDDGLDRDQRRSQSAFHVARAEAPDPAVAKDRLGLEPVARQVLLVARIRCVHVAGEEEIESIAASAPMSDRIRPVFVDQRQVGLHAGFAHALDKILRDADLLAGRARDIDKVDQQVANTFRADVRGDFGKVGFGHERSRQDPVVMAARLPHKPGAIIAGVALQ